MPVEHHRGVGPVPSGLWPGRWVPLLPLARRLEIANRIAEGIGNPAAFAPMVKDIVRGIQEQKENTRKVLAEGRDRTLAEIRAKFGPSEVDVIDRIHAKRGSTPRKS